MRKHKDDDDDEEVFVASGENVGKIMSHGEKQTVQRRSVLQRDPPSAILCGE